MAALPLLTPRQAAERLGMSYPALKHWILAGRIKNGDERTGSMQQHPVLQ